MMMNQAARVKVIRLTDAQQSALECSSIAEGDESFLSPEEVVLQRAWDGERKLTLTPDTHEQIFSALNELSNAEDAAAGETSDPDMRRMANSAARSLACIASKALRVFPNEWKQ